VPQSLQIDELPVPHHGGDDTGEISALHVCAEHFRRAGEPFPGEPDFSRAGDLEAGRRNLRGRGRRKHEKQSRKWEQRTGDRLNGHRLPPIWCSVTDRSGPALLPAAGRCPSGGILAYPVRELPGPGGTFITPNPEEIIAIHRTRVNADIRISPVRLIGPDGEQLGVVPLNVARENAAENGLDLVEVAPSARPPVVRIMDWGKHRYEEQKRARESRKRQHSIDVKELKFRPGTEAHDLAVKVRHARRFLESGKKVKVTVRYRGREMRRPELGHGLLDQVTEALDDLARVEVRSQNVEGRQLTMVLAPE
jgi:translation initiation factor IF-3